MTVSPAGSTGEKETEKSLSPVVPGDVTGVCPVNDTVSGYNMTSVTNSGSEHNPLSETEPWCDCRSHLLSQMISWSVESNRSRQVSDVFIAHHIITFITVQLWKHNTEWMYMSWGNAASPVVSCVFIVPSLILFVELINIWSSTLVLRLKDQRTKSNQQQMLLEMNQHEALQKHTYSKNNRCFKMIQYQWRYSHFGKLVTEHLEQKDKYEECLDSKTYSVYLFCKCYCWCISAQRVHYRATCVTFTMMIEGRDGSWFLLFLHYFLQPWHLLLMSSLKQCRPVVVR